VNRRLIAALLAAVPLMLGIGTGTAAAAPPAPPASAITTPVDQAPAGPGATTFALGGMQRVVVLSCQPSPDRQAWAVPSTPGVVKWMAPPVAYISGSVPIIDTDALGWPIELVALGNDAPGSVPVFRSGCFENHGGAAGGGQSQLSWGDPAQISSTTATGLKVINPASTPGPGASLAILPGASGTDSPSIGSRPLTTTAARVPASPAPVGSAPANTAPVPVYTGTPDNSASSQAASDTGSGILGAGFLGVGGWAIALTLITFALVGLSRANSRRMRTGETDAVTPGATLRGLVAGALAVLVGLVATGVAAIGLPAYGLAAVLAVAAGVTVAHQVASREGHQVALQGLVAAAREAPPYAVGGLVAGAAVGYVVAGSSLISPAEGYSAAVGLVIGAGLTSLRQARAAHQRWLSDAHLVADLMAVPVRAVLEQDEVRFAAQADGGYRITLLNQAARQHLSDLPERIEQIAPQLAIERADRDGVILVPVDADTVAARESVASSGGLVGGAHAGSDPWASQPASKPHTDVDMHKPGSGPLDLSGEDW